MFLLLYFVTVVMVYQMQGLGVLTRESAWVKFIEGCFHCCFALPATFITLSLLGARKEYSHDDYGGWDELSGRLKRKDQVTAILRLDKKLDQLQKQQHSYSARLDKTLDRLQRQQRRDFVELHKLLEERDPKRQEDTLDND
jgi:hypothetical protein